MKNPEPKLHWNRVSDAIGVIRQSHPHIATNVECFWGHREFSDYIHRLLFDTRDGQRRGFTYNVLGALNDVRRVHDETFPHLASPTNNFWTI